MKSLRSAVLFVLCVPFVSAPAQNATPPPNTWSVVKLHYAMPTNTIASPSFDTGDGFCGSVYRSKTGTILSRTGIKAIKEGYRPGFYSNAMVEWDLATGQAAIIDVFRWNGGSSGGGALHTNFFDNPTPTPRHTYDGQAYVEDEDALYLMLGANWRIGGTGATEEAKKQLGVDNQSTWRYSFADKKWTRINGNVNALFGCSPYESHLRHWPEGKRLIFFNDGGNRYAEFDLKEQKWSKAELKNKCPMSLYNARSAWDSKRALWVFRLGPKVCTFDPKAREFKALPDAYDMPGDEKDPKRGWKGVAYISRHDTYLITGPTGNDTFVYPVEKAAWSNIKGGDLPLPNGYPQYDPKTDKVGLVIQLQTAVFQYVPEEEKK